MAGVAEGTVKVQAVLTYWTPGYPMPQIRVVTGPEHEIEVRGFVDVRLDDVGEWGEEDPGAFMAKDGIEQLMLRTCAAGNVTLSWNSDRIGLYTDPACEEQHKVVEDEGSLEGSRRATFTPQYATPPDEDDWDTVFKTTRLWAKALETSAMVGDIHLTLSPVTGQAPPDLLNLTVLKVEFAEFDRVAPTKTKQVAVTTTPSPLPAGCCGPLVCETDAGTTGSATVFPATINQTTTVTITGGTQSWGSGDNAAPNNIKLRAKLGSCVCDEEPFTVCAHLAQCTCALNTTGLNYGLRVNVSWQSETGANCDDLDRCEFTEWITYSVIPNPPFCKLDGSDLDESGTSERIPDPPLSGTVGDDGTVRDTHAHPAALVSSPPTTGSYTVDQDYEYRCNRCNSGWQDALKYNIKYEIYDADPGPGTNLRFRVQKTGPGGPFTSDEDVPGF